MRETSDVMDCVGVEGLLSDYGEGALAEPLRSEAARHLASCAACRELSEALEEVVLALRGAPALEPPAGLAERAAQAALASGRARARPSWRRAPALAWRFSVVPAPLQMAAAAAALAVTGLVLLASSERGSWAAERLIERTETAGVYFSEHKERLVEDFRILRVVVGTAFGSRLESVNDRVEDYRRLLERRRRAEPAESDGAGKTGRGRWEYPPVRSASISRTRVPGLS